MLGTRKSRVNALVKPPYTLFGVSIPATLSQTDGVPYELGIKFQSAVPGLITAIRHYKSPSETGLHTGRIWSSSGSLLASAVFTGETANGWQTQALVPPLRIAENTTYAVSVNINTHFPTTAQGLVVSSINQKLFTVADGANGFFNTTPGNYPNTSDINANYFRDVVFTEDALGLFPNFVGDWKTTPLTTNAGLYNFINTSNPYTHALNFGQTVVKTINNVNFTPIPGTTSNASIDLTAPLVISPSNYGGASALGIDSDGLCDCFVHGTPYAITLKGLTSGTPYRIAFYHYPWDATQQGYIQKLVETRTNRTISFDRAQYLIYWVDILPDQSSITFSAPSEGTSHLFAMTCQRI
jgi:hypothetical protein